MMVTSYEQAKAKYGDKVYKMKIRLAMKPQFIFKF